MTTPQTSPSLTARCAGERGVALVIALMTMLLLTALGVALMLVTVTETRITGNYRGGSEAMYAADAAIERVMQDLLTVPDWNIILAGGLTSSFTIPPTLDDPVSGAIDLTQATNMVNCGKIEGCSIDDMNAPTDERPWGLNNPRWQLYAYGRAQDMLPTETINSDMYVIVWVADDPAECDNDPLFDGNSGVTAGSCGSVQNAYLGDQDLPDPVGDNNMGRGVLLLLAHAYGPGGVRRVIEATVARTDTTEIERGYTGQRGQDEQNRRARKAAVQTPGKALTRRQMTLDTGGFVP